MTSAYPLIEMLLAEGALEILVTISSNDVTYFKDLRILKNGRTNKNFSANTLSARLKELERMGAIKRVPATTTNGRNVVAYKITANGTKALEVSKRFEEELSKFLRN